MMMMTIMMMIMMKSPSFPTTGYHVFVSKVYESLDLSYFLVYEFLHLVLDIL